MIVSASRRTDLPAAYSEWFFNRLQAGFVLVRNPRNARQIWKISLSPETVDGFVFWTKNPAPMLPRLSELEGYPYYFQFTLNAYGRDVEPGVPSKGEFLIPAFQKLSALAGREKVLWRYDPVFLSDIYSMAYHRKYFRRLAEKLSGFTEQCTVSFLDPYPGIAHSMRALHVVQETREQQWELLESFAETAKECGIRLVTCAEPIGAEALGVAHGCCIDKERLERMGHCRLAVGKDPYQRPECGCAASVDIGAYNTCPNGCFYCYANAAPAMAAQRAAAHDPSSPLLFGTVGEEDEIKERKGSSWKERQLSLFLPEQ